MDKLVAPFKSIPFKLLYLAWLIYSLGSLLHARLG